MPDPKANGELNLLNNKIQGTTGGDLKPQASDSVVALERDVELEKRKNRDLQEASREQDKEYQKLKVRYFPCPTSH